MEVTVQATIQNKYGFHARPSTSFAMLAGTFSATVTVEMNASGTRVSGKSVMELMTLGAEQGTVLSIHADGDDAQTAVSALKAHIDDRFGGIE